MWGMDYYCITVWSVFVQKKILCCFSGGLGSDSDYSDFIVWFPASILIVMKLNLLVNSANSESMSGGSVWYNNAAWVLAWTTRDCVWMKQFYLHENSADHSTCVFSCTWRFCGGLDELLTSYPAFCMLQNPPPSHPQTHSSKKISAEKEVFLKSPCGLLSPKEFFVPRVCWHC